MKKKYFRFLSLAFFLVGIFFLINSKIDITGAVVGVSNISSWISSIFGIVFILVSMMLFVSGKSLEERVENVSGKKLKSSREILNERLNEGEDFSDSIRYVGIKYEYFHRDGIYKQAKLLSDAIGDITTN